MNQVERTSSEMAIGTSDGAGLRPPASLLREGPHAAEVVWRDRRTAAELQGFTSLTSNREVRDYLGYLAATYPATVRVEAIGATTRGRPILGVRIGAGRDAKARSGVAEAPARLRVLIFAQQHGNEPAGKEASLLLCRELAAGTLRSLLARLEVWVVPQLNPDGAARGRRRNRSGLDLNRGHHLVRAPEHRALYGLFHRVQPHVTLDLHEHNVALEDRVSRLMPAFDLMAEGPTSLNVSASFRVLALEALAAVAHRISVDGFSYGRYVIRARRGMAARPPRYSTLACFDGRNVPALFGSLSFLLEVTRVASPTAHLERRVRGCFAGVRALLELLAARAESVEAAVAQERARCFERPGGLVTLRARYRRASSDSPATSGGGVRSGAGVAPLTVRSEPRVLLHRVLPQAYWLDLDPRSEECEILAAIVRGHRLRLERAPVTRRVRVQRYWLGERGGDGGKRWRTAIAQVDELEQDLPAGAILLPCAQPGGLLAALLLEPECAESLVASRLWPVKAGELYPVKRVFEVRLATA